MYITGHVSYASCAKERSVCSLLLLVHKSEVSIPIFCILNHRWRICNKVLQETVDNIIVGIFVSDTALQWFMLAVSVLSVHCKNASWKNTMMTSIRLQGRDARQASNVWLFWWWSLQLLLNVCIVAKISILNLWLPLGIPIAHANIKYIQLAQNLTVVVRDH